MCLGDTVYKKGANLPCLHATYISTAVKRSEMTSRSSCGKDWKFARVGIYTVNVVRKAETGSAACAFANARSAARKTVGRKGLYMLPMHDNLPGDIDVHDLDRVLTTPESDELHQELEDEAFDRERRIASFEQWLDENGLPPR